jgi:hypothetical protein
MVMWWASSSNVRALRDKMLAKPFLVFIRERQSDGRRGTKTGFRVVFTVLLCSYKKNRNIAEQFHWIIAIYLSNVNPDLLSVKGVFWKDSILTSGQFTAT